MKERVIYQSASLYRDDFKIVGYQFGEGEKSMCVVGNTRGNEYQQMFTCALLVRTLKNLEERGQIRDGHEILVIPSCNPYSVNNSKRFWPIDNTDINRMFPGYVEGETTQRIAGGIFEEINDYEFGVQLVSNYLPGEFMPCITVMKTGFLEEEQASLARKFGMPYVIMRNPRPYDTTTLNYNWQIWETKAFALYTTCTERIDRRSAQQGVRAILTFLNSQGIMDYRGHAGYHSLVIDDSDMFSVRTPEAGLFEPFVKVQQEVIAGMPIGRIMDPVTCEERYRLTTPKDGIIFHIHAGPMIYGHTAVFKLIPTN